MRKQPNGISVAAKFRNSAGAFHEKEETKQDIKKEIEEQLESEDEEGVDEE